MMMRKIGRAHALSLFIAAITAFTALTTTLFAGPGGVDPTFNVTFSGPVYATLVQPSGKILVGGSFNTVNTTNSTHYGLVRLNSDGSVDGTFTNSFNQSPTIYALLQQPDGKLLVGGSFTTLVNSTTTARVNVARLNVDGSVDGTFTNSSPNSTVYALGLQTDGRVLIGGIFSTVGGLNHLDISRLNADGTLDSSFTNSAPNGAVYAIAVQSDGNILIGGSFTTFSSYSLNRSYLARLLTNGTPDITYSPIANSYVQTVWVQNDGRSLWAGYFGLLDSASRNHVGRLNTDGTLDASFTAPIGSSDTLYTAIEDANGNIYVGGQMRTYNNVVHQGVARLFSDGTTDASFNVVTNAVQPIVRALALQPDGKLIVGGTFTSFGGYPRTNLVRLYGNNYPAEITSQPLSANVVVGASVTFGVLVSNPTALSYQWLKNGVAIPGATDSQYSIFNTQMADAATYSVQVNSGFGSTTSSNALLQVGYAPVITQSPTNITANLGDSPAFSATVTGTAPLSYFWKSGTAVYSTNTTLNFTNVQPGNSLTYYLVVTNLFGGATSSVATLTVLYPVAIVTNPVSQSIPLGSNVSFTVSATGNPLAYQWYFNNAPVTGATAATLSLSTTTLPSSGSYFVIVSNQFNSLTSSIATLSIIVPPQNLAYHLGANNAFALQISAIPGSNYILQAATNLQAPIFWQNLVTNPADTNGLWSYLDTNTATFPSRYYRLLGP